MLDIFFNRLSFSIPVGILLSILLQSVFLFVIKDNPNVYFNGHFVPLWTHDAGLYGFYAKQLLNGVNLPFNSEYMAGWLLYGITKFSPFSIEQVIFYSPVFLSSLIIIPIIFISRFFDLQKVGFFAGILSTLSYGYYYRSFFGYFDTDILNLFFPLVAIWGLVGLSFTKNRFYLLLASLGMFLFSLWYHSFLAIGAGIIGIWIIYILIFQREEFINYLAIFILSIPLLHVSLWIEILAIFVIFALSFLPIKNSKYFPFGFLLFVVAFFASTNISFQRALEYIDKSLYIKSANLSFLNTLNTVAEAGGIGFTKWGELTSANLSLAFLSIFGFILLCIKQRQFLLFLPLAFLGLLSIVAGERFVLYGVVAFSFGISYFAFMVSENIKKYNNIVFITLLSIVTIFFIQKIINFAKIETPIFNKQDLEVLSKLPKDKNNFILTWWDYGWPLWYETGAKTLIDNGKHFEDNYIISKLLFFPNQAYVANASKQSVRLYKEANSKGSYKLVPYLFKKNTPQIALQNLAKPSKATRPIYWYLNTNLLTVGLDIKSFSDIDLKSGKKLMGGFLAYLKKSNQVKFDKINGIVNLNGQKFNIQSYTNTKTKEFKKYNGIDIQFIETPTHYLSCTANIYNSFLVQTLIFKNVNKNLFDIVSYNDTSMILKVK